MSVQIMICEFNKTIFRFSYLLSLGFLFWFCVVGVPINKRIIHNMVTSIIIGTCPEDKSGGVK